MRSSDRPAHTAHVANPVAPHAVAKTAGLRYVPDRIAGIVRVRRGKTFRYLGPDGKPVHDTETLKRIRSLMVLPP